MKKESVLKLNPRPTLKDFQEYVVALVKERGFEEQRLSETFLLFFEECGEMAKAARKSQGLKVDKNSNEHHLDLEIADVFIFLLRICNDSGIDLEKAFRDKEEINKQRIWS